MKIRPNIKPDLPQILQLIGNDKFGKLREDYQSPLPSSLL